MLITAPEANKDVLKMEVLTERLLHAKRKQKEKTCYDKKGDGCEMTIEKLRSAVPLLPKVRT